MHISAIDRDSYKQPITINPENKALYGEIFTPFSLITIMLDMMSPETFTDPSKTFMDCGAGTGFFSMMLFWRLDKGLSSAIPNENERRKHIIKNMLYMCEIRNENSTKIKTLFGEEANIIEGDYLSYTCRTFDYIIGNPPYNCNGIKKVPTNYIKDKKKDGITIWSSFVRHSFGLLKPSGEIMLIIPSIWMKPDKEKTYEFVTNFKLKKIRCMSNTLTNSYFKGEAQTPTCLVYAKNVKNDYCVSLYDTDMKIYVNYPYYIGEALPVFGASILKKIKGDAISPRLRVFKTNMPPKRVSIRKEFGATHPYINIRTAIIVDKKDASLVVDYSSIPLSFAGRKKLVMPHKMYGFPYLDREGKYGISNRDSYVILSDSNDYLTRLCEFFKTKTAIYLFECTRYRMKYLEKYIFDMIPDIASLSDFPREINDDTIAAYFGLSAEEQTAIISLHATHYSFKYI
jgi:tRNA1(Val) A37 N6-methylase TrmN6